MSGENEPITWLTLSKSIIPTIIIRRAQITLPIFSLIPKAWFKLDPAPAIITKPTTKHVNIKDRSINFEINLLLISSNTSEWSVAR